MTASSRQPTAKRSRALHAPEVSELSRLATPEIGDERLQRVFLGVRERIADRGAAHGLGAHGSGSARRARLVGLLAAALTAASVGLFLMVGEGVSLPGTNTTSADTASGHTASTHTAEAAALGVPEHSAIRAPGEGAVLTAGGAPLEVLLGDESRLTLAGGAKVVVETANPSRVELALANGTVECDVQKNPGREFVVRAGDVSVRVVGTQFTVERWSNSVDRGVRVGVERGVVEVSGPEGEIKRLRAGERWERAVPLDDSGADVRRGSPDATTRAASGAADQSGAAERRAEGELFERAMAMRQAGRFRESARAFAEFVSSRPGDARAAIAWFELGRLKMDRLGDLRGAEQALARFLGRGSGASGAGGLTEDALARLVRARAALGMTKGCRAARSRYLAEYPSGVHVAEVSRFCSTSP